MKQLILLPETDQERLDRMIADRGLIEAIVVALVMDGHSLMDGYLPHRTVEQWLTIDPDCMGDQPRILLEKASRRGLGKQWIPTIL